MLETLVRIGFLDPIETFTEPTGPKSTTAASAITRGVETAASTSNAATAPYTLVEGREMGCGNCGRDNREGASFCDGCGARLAVVCAACGQQLRTEARFCDGCGTQVGGTAPAPASHGGDPTPNVPAGSRKVVTILFADLAGSTGMQERLDAEATARLMERIQSVLATAVESEGGRVVKSTGDGVMAVFGIPVLHEDDALRAVRAGLAMQATFASLGDELEQDLGIAVGLRVGVNTGEVASPASSSFYRIPPGRSPG